MAICQEVFSIGVILLILYDTPEGAGRARVLRSVSDIPSIIYNTCWLYRYYERVYFFPIFIHIMFIYLIFDMFFITIWIKYLTN